MTLIDWTRKVEAAEDRLDRFLLQHLEGYSRSRVQDAIRSGRVSVNGRRAKKGDRVRRGDEVAVTGVAEHGLQPEPEAELAVVYEDGDVAVVDKPEGLPTHPLAPDETNTLINRTLARWPQTQGVGPEPLEPGLLHRLDTGTSGLVIIGMNQPAFDALKDDLRRGRVTKIYRALVAGELKKNRDEINTPLARHPRDKGLMVPATGDAKFRGRPLEAVTRYRVLEARDGITLLELQLVTGVMHQLRVHLALIGHPVLGDDRYGPNPDPNSRAWALQASALAFRQPQTGDDLEIIAPKPLELEDTDRWRK